MAGRLFRIDELGVIAALGTLSLYRGLALAISDGGNVADLPRTHPYFTVVGGDVLGCRYRCVCC